MPSYRPQLDSKLQFTTRYQATVHMSLSAKYITIEGHHQRLICPLPDKKEVYGQANVSQCQAVFLMSYNPSTCHLEVCSVNWCYVHLMGVGKLAGTGQGTVDSAGRIGRS